MEKMKKTLDDLRKNFSGVRTGRASPALVEGILVDYYGSSVPLKQLAQITVPESRMLVITPYDKSSSKDIEKSIQKSDLGLTPNTESGVIRLNMPQLTEERRKELVKHLKKLSEDSKVALRNIRRDILDSIKKDKIKHSEDDIRQKEDEIQKITDKYILEVDKLVLNKEKEVMEV